MDRSCWWTCVHCDPCTTAWHAAAADGKLPKARETGASPGRFTAGRTAWKRPVDSRRMQSCSMSYVLTGVDGCALSRVATWPPSRQPQPCPALPSSMTSRRTRACSAVGQPSSSGRPVRGTAGACHTCGAGRLSTRGTLQPARTRGGHLEAARGALVRQQHPHALPADLREDEAGLDQLDQLLYVLAGGLRDVGHAQQEYLRLPPRLWVGHQQPAHLVAQAGWDLDWLRLGLPAARLCALLALQHGCRGGQGALGQPAPLATAALAVVPGRSRGPAAVQARPWERALPGALPVEAGRQAAHPDRALSCVAGCGAGSHH